MIDVIPLMDYESVAESCRILEMYGTNSLQSCWNTQVDSRTKSSLMSKEAAS
jgi:hypothetical protein